jgi:hypothetical protein
MFGGSGGGFGCENTLGPNPATRATQAIAPPIHARPLHVILGMSLTPRYNPASWRAAPDPPL